MSPFNFVHPRNILPSHTTTLAKASQWWISLALWLFINHTENAHSVAINRCLLCVFFWCIYVNLAAMFFGPSTACAHRREIAVWSILHNGPIGDYVMTIFLPRICFIGGALHRCAYEDAGQLWGKNPQIVWTVKLFRHRCLANCCDRLCHSRSVLVCRLTNRHQWNWKRNKVIDKIGWRKNKEQSSVKTPGHPTEFTRQKSEQNLCFKGREKSNFGVSHAGLFQLLNQ